MDMIEKMIKAQKDVCAEIIFQECLHSAREEFPNRDLTEIVLTILQHLQAKGKITPRLEEVYKQTLREVERRNKYKNDIIFKI